MRCRNCGLLGHRTNVCPRYGPWYPEPGKEKEDYAKESERITNLVAGDIMAEHEGRELQEEYVLTRKPRKSAKARHADGEGHPAGPSASPAPAGEAAQGDRAGGGLKVPRKLRPKA